MNIEEIQKAIDKMQYWDAKIMDLNIRHFGDEIEVLIENEETNYCWCIIFESCSSVTYKTDAVCRKKNLLVKDMKKGQLGYYGQDISVRQSELADFVDVHMDLTLIEFDIVCRNIIIKKYLYDSKYVFGLGE